MGQRIRMKPKPPYTRCYRDRHGKLRWEFRKKGCKGRPLPGGPGSDGFWEAYDAALRGAEAPQGVGATETVAGSINALVVRYYSSPEFDVLAQNTKKTYRSIFERFREDHGSKPVDRLERKHVKAMLDRKRATPSEANKFLKYVRRLMAFAVENELLEHNPCFGIKPLKITSDGYHAWTDAEIVQFLERHHEGGMARLALLLALYTGQRRSDVIRMGWKDIEDGYIKVRQEKTKAHLGIPIAPALAEAIKGMPRDRDTFLVTAQGQPFTSAGIGNWFRKRCDEAGLHHCSMHGLRKAAARRLAEAGCTDRQIMSITGHKTAQEVGRYTRSAEQMKLAEQAMGLLKVSNPASSVRHLHDQVYEKPPQSYAISRPGGTRTHLFQATFIKEEAASGTLLFT